MIYARKESEHTRPSADGSGLCFWYSVRREGGGTQNIVGQDVGVGLFLDSIPPLWTNRNDRVRGSEAGDARGEDVLHVLRYHSLLITGPFGFLLDYHIRDFYEPQTHTHKYIHPRFLLTWSYLLFEKIYIYKTVHFNFWFVI